MNDSKLNDWAGALTLAHTNTAARRRAFVPRAGRATEQFDEVADFMVEICWYQV
jgi:hypothetical protein